MESLSARRQRLGVAGYRRSSWRRPVLVGGLLAFIALLGFGSVAWALVPTVGTRLAVPGGSYSEAVVGNPVSINPLFADFNEIDRDLVSLVFSGLTRVDDDGTIVPDLAESWTVSDDALVYTFRLRSNVKFHDGQPLTATDVAFTVRAMQDASFQGNPALSQVWRKVQVEQTDDHAIRFVLKEPYSPLLSYTTVGILPAHLLASVPAKDLRGNAFRNHPIGSGPFALKELTLQHALLEPFPDYYGRPPYLQSVELRFYPSYETALAGLKQGEVLGMGSVKPGDLAALQDNASLRVYRGLRSNQLEVILNLRTPPVADRAVRQSLVLGLDRQRLVRNVVGGQALPADGPIIPGSWLSGHEVREYPYDPTLAKKTLDDAGWRLNGGGIRQKDGVPLRLSLLTNNDDETRIKVAEEVASQWREIGVQADVSTSGFAGLLQNFLIPRRFDAVIYGVEAGLDPDVYSLWHSSQTGVNGFNLSSFANQRADEVLDQARRTPSADARTDLYREFRRIFAQEVPSIPLYYPTYGYVVSSSVQGIRLGLMEDPGDRFQGIASWFMKTKRQLRTPIGTFDF